ncbi:DUF2851 family protein [Aquimarina sp. AU474]|uniref:DUF2851 family protein n=1 Tax=Aquimarina sp. AU474 TaxID=2108529 RepID=UPI000D692E47|nr:DUF2851 family protein [Aquimarina sp. AU474]
MKEDLLQYIWKYKKFDFSNLRTTTQDKIILQKTGIHNTGNSGPDFFNSQMIIQNQKWAGNVEIHIKSSDWYIHHHEVDRAYDNVILHVVWEEDIEVFRKDNTTIPTLQLKDYVSKQLLIKYQELFSADKQKWIPCENNLPAVSSFTLSNWQERLYIERLEQKSKLISQLLKNSANNWEAVLFRLLTKNFGLKTNGEAFLHLAERIDFSIIRKCSYDLNKLEALFFGQTGLLSEKPESKYENQLQEEYRFLKNKFLLDNTGVLPVQFFRLRPYNFPTIRLAQLASLYNTHINLFDKIIHINTIEGFYDLFEIEVSSFWKNHYTFKKESTVRKKRITKSFIDLILINTIIPIRFMVAREMGKNAEDEVLQLISKIPKEKNSIIERFSASNVKIENAMQSQAMIQLKNSYCDQKSCLQCGIGNYLLNQDRSVR